MKIFLALIEHSGGTNAYPCATEAERLRQVFQYVKAYWNDYFDTKPMPGNPEAAIEFYFNEENYCTTGDTLAQVDLDLLEEGSAIPLSEEEQELRDAADNFWHYLNRDQNMRNKDATYKCILVTLDTLLDQFQDFTKERKMEIDGE